MLDPIETLLLRFIALTSNFVSWVRFFVTHAVLFPCWVLVGQTCQAKTWQQVSASNPFERYYHSAVMDMQQRMWIFGGDDGKNGRGPTVKPACVLWRLLWVRPVGQRTNNRYLRDCCDVIMRFSKLEWFALLWHPGDAAFWGELLFKDSGLLG